MMKTKNNVKTKLSQKISNFALTTPKDLVQDIIKHLNQWDQSNWDYASAELLARIYPAQVKADLHELLTIWHQNAPEMPAAALAVALSACLHTIQNQSKMDLVWTGPDSKVLPYRRTDQTLLQVIRNAQSNLLIVSFAVYKIPSIAIALEETIKRGVKTTIILEDPHISAGKISYTGFNSFKSQTLEKAHFYIWLLENRLQTENGQYGSLHAKLAVADEQSLFLTSANLTEYAMELNIEMGVLIQGGELPIQLVRHFEALITSGVLTRAKVER
jgi:phosphatidylserine/phosphatidylglycerophosphate/cardiolipin synthase-like enzyme